MLLQLQISVYKHFSGAGKVCINTSPAPERCFKYFPGFSGAGEVYLNTSPAPEKYFYIIYLSDTSPASEKVFTIVLTVYFCTWFNDQNTSLHHSRHTNLYHDTATEMFPFSYVSFFKTCFIFLSTEYALSC